MSPRPSVAATATALVMLVCATVASASSMTAIHFGSNHLYIGRSPSCAAGATKAAGYSCTFRFHADATGTQLTFVGTTAIDTWGCRGGGGEALLGGAARYASPNPVITVTATGTLHGSTGNGKKDIFVTGTLTRSGMTAVIVFHGRVDNCVTRSVTLSEH